MKKSAIKKFERQLNMPITSEYLDEERGIAWNQQVGILYRFANASQSRHGARGIVQVETVAESRPP